MLLVEDPGLLAAVQDGGRPGAVVLGVPRGGACDPDGMTVANLLLGNPADAPVIELTLGGARLVAEAPLVVALGGADLGAHIADEDRRVPPGSAVLVRAGSAITFTGSEHGARAYLAVPGGLDVPRVLGSASACPVARFPGLAGRPIARGDRLAPARAGDTAAAGRTWPQATGGAAAPATLRVVPGPGRAALDPEAESVLLGTAWTVAESSDRVGVRLVGPAEACRSLADAVSGVSDAASLPMTWGALQVPPSGEPICLGPDAGTVGGYAVPFVVATVDRGTLGQLRPGDEVRLRAVAADDARMALLERRRRIAAALALLSSDPDWEAVADATG